MKKLEAFCKFILVILGIYLINPGYATGYTLNYSNGVPLTWSGNSVTFNINTSGAPSYFSSQVQAAMNNWNDLSGSNFTFNYGNETSASGFNNSDGEHVVYWGTAGGGAIGRAGWWSNSSGKLFSCDVVLDNTYSGWTTEFVNSVATHELGHCLPLGHSSDPTAVMYPTLTNSNLSLNQDDINAITALYPITLTSGPSSFSSSVNGQTVTLSWGSLTGAAGYKIYWSTGDATKYSNSVEAGNITNVVATNVPPNTYYMIITAYNSAGESGSSSEKNFTVSSSLSTPSSFNNNVVGSTATLSWDAVSGASGYRLYWGTGASGVYTNSVDVGNQISVVGNNVPVGTYYMIVRAYNGSTESANSNETVITVQ